MTSRYPEVLTASVPYDSIENGGYYQNTNYPAGYLLKVVLTNDSIWPPTTWKYQGIRSDTFITINSDSLRHYLRLVARTGGQLRETVSWISHADTGSITVSYSNGSLPFVERRFAISDVQYLQVDRNTRRYMRLTTATPDDIGTFFTVTGAMPLGLAPLLAFGRWHGLSGSYVARYLWIVGGGAVFMGIGHLFREIGYAKRRRYVIHPPTRYR